MQIAPSFFTYLALVKRDFYVLRSKIGGYALEASFLIFYHVIVFGCLLPFMGMQPERIIPTYIGVLIFLLFNRGFVMIFRIRSDIEHNKFIEYHLTLPLGTYGVIAAYITRIIVEIALIMIPLAACSLFLLRNVASPMGHIQWGSFILIYLVSSIFFSVGTLTLYLTHSFTWIMDNIWARTITPLLLLSSVQWPLPYVQQCCPLVAKFFLCNPLSYIGEGLRTTLLHDYVSLPLWIDIVILCTWTIALLPLLARSIRKQLDPV